MMTAMRILPSMLAAGLAALPSAQEVLTPERLLSLHRAGSPRLAPDGKHLLFTVTTPDVERDTSATGVWLLDLTRDGAEPVEVGAGHSPRWLDSGAEFVWVTDAGLRLRNLLEDGPDRVLPVRGGLGSLLLAPGGTRFAFTRNVKLDVVVADQNKDLPAANARAYDDLMVRHWDRWRDGTYSHLFVQPLLRDGPTVDLMAGEKVHTPLPPFGGVEQIAWSPDGKELCYTARRVADPEQSTDSSLWVVSANGGEHRNLTAGMPGYDLEPRYSPDGRWIAFSSMARGGFEADRVRLFVHERRTGENRELLPDFDGSVHDVTWSSDSQQLFFTVDWRGSTQVFRTPLAEPEAQQVTRGHRRQRPCLRRARAAERRRGMVRRHRRQAHHAWIVKPPGFDAKKRYPMLLYCQGGPQSMVGQWFSYRWNFHLMAAKGYVVAAVNRRGLPGFGQAWNDEISRDWGGQAMRDLLSVCDAMQARDYIDERRTAAVGASFGGYSVFWLMGNGGDRFACMISHCGVFNLESMYLATEELFFVDWEFGGPYPDLCTNQHPRHAPSTPMRQKSGRLRRPFAPRTPWQNAQRGQRPACASAVAFLA